MSALLQATLSRRVEAYVDAIDQLRDDAEPDTYGDRVELGDEEREKIFRTLREAVEIVRCLRRLLEGKTVREVHVAFGAPGDFGYETEIGEALARVYRGEGPT